MSATIRFAALVLFASSIFWAAVATNAWEVALMAVTAAVNLSIFVTARTP